MVTLLQSERIRMRALEPEDVELIYRWENNTDYWDLGCTNAPYSRQQVRDYLASTTSDIFTDKELRLIIEDANGKAVGIADLTDFDLFNSRVAIGLLIDTQEQGKGYGTEASRLIVDYVKNFLGIHQLYAEIPASNIRSAAIFDKLGFMRSGILKSWQKQGNTYADIIIFQKIF